MKWFCAFASNDSDAAFKKFYMVTKYDPQFVIFRSDFVDSWSQLGNLDLFKWIPEVVTGLKSKHMNIDADAEP